MSTLLLNKSLLLLGLPCYQFFFIYVCMYVCIDMMHIFAKAPRKSPLLTGFRICQLHSLQRSNTSPQKISYPKYNTKLHLIMKLQFLSYGECGVTTTLPLLPGSLWPRVVVPISIPSMGQIDVLENDLYITMYKLFFIKNRYLTLLLFTDDFHD